MAEKSLMDSTMIQKRNYQLVERVRRKNERAQKELDELITAPHGITSNYRFHIDELEKEKRLIRVELKNIRRSTITTKGELPPKHLRSRPKPEPEVSFNQRGKKTKKQEKYQEKTEEDMRIAQEKLRKFTEDLMEKIYTIDDDMNSIDHVLRANDSSSPRRRQSLTKSSINVNVNDVKASVAKRLTAPDNAPGDEERSPASVNLAARTYNFMESLHPVEEEETEVVEDKKEKQKDDKVEIESPAPKVKKKKKENESDSSELSFDAEVYHPDGRLRTVHVMPNLNMTIKQAKKARYVRHKEKQWFEKELSVGEIFNSKNQKSAKAEKTTKTKTAAKTDTAAKTNTAAAATANTKQ